MTNNGNLTSYTYDLNNRLLQEVSGDEYTFYNYDDRGNLYSKRTDERSTAGNLTRVDTFGALKDHVNSTVELYSYDGLNRLNEVRKGGITAQYTYNAEGIRTSKTVNGVTTDFLLDGSNVVAETKNGSTINYIRGLTGIISSSIQGTNNTTKYYTSDGHGNITKLTDSTGTIVKTYVYDAFDVEQNIDSNDTNPFRYCGEYYDSEIRQIYLRARYYNPAIGRFTQQDPAMDGMNWYLYCHNNSINFKDSSGCTEYYVNGMFPSFQFDHTFPYNPNAVATAEDYKNWDNWGKIAFASGYAPWLKDASKAYKHYRENTGTDMWVDYERAYEEDSVIRSNIDSQIGTMKNAVKWLYDNQWGTSFNITGEIFGIPNGSSENWQKTIGAHQVFGVGSVTIDPKTGMATMVVTFYMEDMYNFNPGMSDIASGTPDDINGSFSELGWAKEFKTYGSLTKTIKWQLFNPAKNNKKGGSGR